MNEHDWLTGTTPLEMLEYLEGTVSDRKLRLFACACVRSKWGLIPFRRQRGAVELAERWAEGRATESEVAEARERATIWTVEAPEFERSVYLAAAATLEEVAYIAARDVCDSIVGQAMNEATIEAALPSEQDTAALKAVEATTPALCALIREVFGNPFRPVTIDPAWLAWSDGAVLAIAREIDDAQRFGELPYLADALTDAGCDNAELLRHLREGGHVRGCWALDAVLGRQ